MKGKSQHHRTENRFRFKSFADRLADINIDVVHRISRPGSELDADADHTHFYEGLQKWSDLNCTETFSGFVKEVANKCETLPQLLHHQPAIVDSLIRHLDRGNALSLEPLLDLAVQLARDAGLEFRPHFPDTFQAFVRVLDRFPQEPDVLEWTFASLSHVFKFLWRYILKDLEGTFCLLSPLLDSRHRRRHVVAFAAESYAFLLRKSRDLPAFVDFLVAKSIVDSDLVPGVARVFFEMLKGLKGRTHSTAAGILPMLVTKLDPSKHQDSERARVFYEELQTALQLLIEHVERSHSDLLWETLIKSAFKTHQSLMNSPSAAIATAETETNTTKTETTPMETETTPDDLNGASPSSEAENLDRLMKLISMTISFKDGNLVTQTQIPNLQNLFSQLFSARPAAFAPYLSTSVTAFSSFLLGSSVPPLHLGFSAKCLGLLFSSSSSSPALPCPLLVSLVHSLSSSNRFDREVLPHFLRLVCDDAALQPPRHERRLFSALFRLLRERGAFSEEDAAPESLIAPPTSALEDRLTYLLEASPESTPVEMMWHGVKLLPRLELRNPERAVGAVTEIVKYCINSLKTDEILQLLSSSVHALYFLPSPCSLLPSLFPVDEVIHLLAFFPSDVFVLSVSRLLLRLTPPSVQRMKEVFEILKGNLASPYSLVRKLTLDILASLPWRLPPPDDPSDPPVESVFSIMLAAESTPTTFHTYRDRLVHLRRLDGAHVHRHLPFEAGPSIQQTPTLYLCANLLINFKLLWEPVKELLKTHAEAAFGDDGVFWSVFGEQLALAAERSEEALYQKRREIPESTANASVDDVGFLDADMKAAFKAANPAETERTDFSNFRFLLWDAMASFARAVEPRGVELKEMFMKFVEEEFRHQNPEFGKTQNLRKNRKKRKGLEVEEEEEEDVAMENEEEEEEKSMEKDEKNEEENDDDSFEASEDHNEIEEQVEPDSEEEVDEEENESDNENNRSFDKLNVSLLSLSAATAAPHAERRRASEKSLLVHLSLFSKFSKPRRYDSDAVLRGIFLEFLDSPSVAVQKAALECVFAYGESFVNPYKENLERFVDVKTFRTEVAMFSMEEEATSVLEVHRPKFFRLLLPILRGKMRQKTGRAVGKDHTFGSKTVVVRFVAGCRSDEAGLFLRCLFNAVADDSDSSRSVAITAEGMPQFLEDFSADAVSPPLKDQEEILGLLEMTMSKMGDRIFAHLPYILRVILRLGAGAKKLLDEGRGKVSSIHPSHLSRLRNVKNASFKRVAQFFKLFDFYPFTSAEIDAIFEIFIWPYLGKQTITKESLASPTPCLKLLHSWTLSSRYFPLLTKCRDGTAPVDVIFEMMNSPDLKKPVLQLIVDCIDRLLNSSDHSTAPNLESTAPAPCHILAEGCRISPSEVNKDQTIGLRVLLPFVSEIFKYLHGVMRRISRKKDASMPARELTMLSTMSPFIRGDAEADTIIRVLLPYLSRWKVRAAAPVITAKQSWTPKVDASDDDLETSLLRVLHHAFALSSRPRNYVIPILKLFGSAPSSDRNNRSRHLLIQILGDVAGIDAHIAPLHALAIEVNAMNPKVLDEPDYGRRLVAYEGFGKRLLSLSTSDENLDKTAEKLRDFEILLMLYNSLHFLRLADDIALRSSSLNCLKKIVKYVGSQGNETMFKRIIVNHLMLEIRRSLSDPKERIRHEFIGLLGQVVRCCGKSSSEDGETSKSFAVELKRLIDDTDPEVDFFENLIHIQIHRRPRALTRLTKQLEAKELGYESVHSYIFPILTAILNEDSYLKHQNILVEECVKALVAACKFAPWSLYYTTLMTFLKRLTIPGTKSRIAVKVVVPLLEAFHFDLSLSRGLKRRKDGMEKGNKGKTKENAVEKGVEINLEENEEIKSDEDEPMETTEDNDAEEDEENEKKSFQTSWVDPSRPLSEEDATEIHQTIAKIVIPQLNRQLIQKKKGEEVHKLSKGEVYDENEALRVPLAMAMVKLLSKLPDGMLQSHVTNIITKVIQFLKSFDQEVRQASRETLKHILVTLGPKYFFYIITELKETLLKGFMKHVLNFTVHKLLKTLAGTNSLRKLLEPSNFDACVPVLSEIYCDELFGDVGEEREVEAITNKIHEAKGACKSYDSYLILGKNVSPSMLTTLLMPLRNKLNSSQSKEIVGKISTCLSMITNGLAQNKSIPVELLLTIAHGFSKDGFEGIVTSKKKEVDVPVPSLRPESCLLLPENPGRAGFKPQTTSATNKNVLIDFGLQLLQMCLKRGKVKANNVEHLGMLDPFVSILSECLDAKHTKTAATALQTLCLILKFPNLPSLMTHFKDIADAVFVIVHRYGTGGLTKKGEIAELVAAAYKALNIVLHKSSKPLGEDEMEYRLTEDQLKALVMYVEHDVAGADSVAADRQPTAFSMLKALLARKFNCKELIPLMDKVFILAIKSPLEGVRSSCRQLSLQYLVHYPLGKRIKGHLQFFLRQLEYDGFEDGRASALEMVQALLQNFPKKSLDTYATNVMFLPLAARLINEESQKVRKMVGIVVKGLLQKVDVADRDTMFDSAMVWLRQDSGDAPTLLAQRRLGAQLIGIFAEAEGSAFERRLDDVLPALSLATRPDKFEDEEKEDGDDGDENDNNLDDNEEGWETVGAPSREEGKKTSSAKDGLLFMLLNSFKKIIVACGSNVWRRKKVDDLLQLLESAVEFLYHPHSWIRLVSSQIFGLYFASFKIETLKVDATDATPSGVASFLTRDPVGQVRQLCGAFCHQMQSEFLTKDLATQIVKNLLFMVKVIRFLRREREDLILGSGEDDEKKMEEEEEEEESDEGPGPVLSRMVIDSETGEEASTAPPRHKLSLDFVLRRVVFEALKESTHQSRGTLRQTAALQFSAALVSELDADETRHHLPTMLRVLRRATSSGRPSADDAAPGAADRESLRRLAKEFSDIVEKRAGQEAFAFAMVRVEKMAGERKAQRRQQAALLKVVDPVRAATKKINRKRKGGDGAKGKKKGKKTRLKDLAVIE